MFIVTDKSLHNNKWNANVKHNREHINIKELSYQSLQFIKELTPLIESRIVFRHDYQMRGKTAAGRAGERTMGNRQDGMDGHRRQWCCSYWGRYNVIALALIIKMGFDSRRGFTDH